MLGRGKLEGCEGEDAGLLQTRTVPDGKWPAVCQLQHTLVGAAAAGGKDWVAGWAAKGGRGTDEDT